MYICAKLVNYFKLKNKYMTEELLHQLKDYTSAEKISILFRELRDFLPRGYAAKIVNSVKEKHPESKISSYQVRNIVYGTSEVDEYNVFEEVLRLAKPHIEAKIKKAESIFYLTQDLDKVAVIKAIEQGRSVVIQ